MGKEPLSPKHFHPHGINMRIWKKVGLVVFFPPQVTIPLQFFFPFSQDVFNHLPLYKTCSDPRGDLEAKLQEEPKGSFSLTLPQHMLGQIFRCSQHSMNQSWRWLQLPE